MQLKEYDCTSPTSFYVVIYYVKHNEEEALISSLVFTPLNIKNNLLIQTI